jgi:hypothetical protein
LKLAGIEVLSAVVMSSSIFWGIPPCSGFTFTRLHGVISQTIELFRLNDVLDIWYWYSFTKSYRRMSVLIRRKIKQAGHMKMRMILCVHHGRGSYKTHNASNKSFHWQSSARVRLSGFYASTPSSSSWRGA